jgi:hypothetical protein
MRLTLFLLLVSPCLASPVLTFSGSGLENLITFQFTSPVPLDTFGLTAYFAVNFDYCTAPSGEVCNQVDYSAGGGNLTWEAIVLAGGTDTRTFEFPQYLDDGVYNTVGGSPGTGTLTITGSTDPVPEPRYGLLLGGLSLIFPAWRRRRCCPSRTA